MPQTFALPLLATEHTEFDRGAEALAFALARQRGAPLAAVLPIVSNAEFLMSAPELAARADEQAAKRRRELEERARAQGVALELSVRHGAALDAEIVDQARRIGADPIVIRRRGKRSFLAQMMVGEMVGKVVAHAPCSVLVVPRDAQLWQRRVLAAVEADAQGGRVAALAIRLAAEARLPLTLLTVHPAAAQPAAGGAELAQWRRDAEAAGVAADSETASGAAAEQILAAARRLQADLIVMGVRSAAHAARAKVGRVAHEVTGRYDGAVLLVSSAERGSR